MSLPAYPAYRESGVPWLGQVPAGWGVALVKSVASCNDDVLPHHFLEEEDVAWLARFRSLELSDEMLKALVFVRERGRINNATYRDLVQCHPPDATRDLRRLCELGLLLPEGNTTSRIYRPGPAMLAAMAAAGGMPDKADTMHDKGVAMHGKAGTISDSGLPDLPEDLRDLLMLLGRRTEPKMLHGVVWRRREALRLAPALGRAPRHPDQAYRAAPRGGRNV